MGLFRPYERETEATAPEPEPAPIVIPNPAKPAKKGAATPSRREAEAARRERLNPTLTRKQARARERKASAAQRDERFAKAENVPSKVLARNFVDSHRGISQWAMPVLAITLALSLLITSIGAQAALVVTILTYAVFLSIGVDVFLVWFKFKRLLADRLPGTPRKGLLAYIINRSISLRRLRMPPPVVKPGDKI